jgi:hypothetical protein
MIFDDFVEFLKINSAQQQYLFNAGWSSKHEQYIAAQLQQQVDTVFSGNSQKVENFVLIVITTGLEVR